MIKTQMVYDNIWVDIDQHNLRSQSHNKIAVPNHLNTSIQ